MSLRLRLLALWLRHVERRALARATDPRVLRRRFERQAFAFRHPPFTAELPDRIGGVGGLWVWSRAAPGRGAILYLHGGGYVMGSPATHAALAARLSALTGLRVFLPDYRLAPEHPFPAAPDDARAVWQGLVARGYDPRRIVIAGDSAGGGLALSLLGRIRADGGPDPAGVLAFSPWTDMTLGGASWRENAASEMLLPAERAAELRDQVLAGFPAEDPLASPLRARFDGAPPVFIQFARTEILLDDARAMADRLAAQGVEVSRDEMDDFPHAGVIFQGWLPEADAALARAAAFVRALGGPDQAAATEAAAGSR